MQLKEVESYINAQTLVLGVIFQQLAPFFFNIFNAANVIDTKLKYISIPENN